MSEERDYLETVAQVAARNPGLTEAAVRGYIRNRDINGLAKAGGVVKRGRRVFLIQPAFDDWLTGKLKPDETRALIDEHQERLKRGREILDMLDEL